MLIFKLLRALSAPDNYREGRRMLTDALLIVDSGALSSVGSEHLPYKQGVVGSNPTGPTKGSQLATLFLYELHSLHPLF